MRAFVVATMLAATVFSVPAAVAAPAHRCAGRFATIRGTHNDNILIGTPGRDVIWSGAGSDSVIAGSGNDLICGNRGDDYISGGPGFDRARGGWGNDVCDTERFKTC